MSRRSYRVVFNCTVVFNLILATRETIFYSVLFTLWFVGIFFNPKKQFYESGTHATLDFVLTFKFIFSVVLFHGSFHIKRILGQIRKDSHGLIHNRFLVSVEIAGKLTVLYFRSSGPVILFNVRTASHTIRLTRWAVSCVLGWPSGIDLFPLDFNFFVVWSQLLQFTLNKFPRT